MTAGVRANLAASSLFLVITLCCCLWIHGRFRDIDRRLDEIDRRLDRIEKEVEEAARKIEELKRHEAFKEAGLEPQT